jgi:predicted MFS family arabinose efflux permease
MNPRTAVLALGLTQIIGYGTLYYSFSILAPAMAREFALSLEWVFAALSLSFLVGGLCAPWVGGWIDRRGAGRVMTIGSLTAAAALTACAFAVNSATLVLGLIAIQIASTLVQYSASFTLLVQLNPAKAQRSITHLTLAAGFSSTLFWPFTTALHAHLDWHHVYLLFALMHLLICLPLHGWLMVKTRAISDRRGPQENVIPSAADVAGIVDGPARPRAFTLMLVGFAIQSFVTSTFLVHMLSMLSGLGLANASVLVASVFGPAQVLSRFTNMTFGGRLSQRTLAIIASGFLPLATGILLATAPSLTGAFAFAIVFGLSSGLSSIVQGTLPLELFGSNGYGKRLGRVTSARLIVSSAAPFAFALMTARLGYPLALSVIAILSALALFAFVAIGRSVKPPRAAN